MPGVVPETKPEARSVRPPKTSAAWFDPASTRYDFGLVLAGSDVTRPHTFRVVNTSGRAVRVRGVVNRKPCCGDVAPIAAGVVEPGQAIEVVVTLHIGLGAGQVLHVAEIEAEGDGENPGVEIRTTATTHARALVEDVRPDAGPLEPGQPRRVEFLLRSFGVATDPPPILDDRAIRCGLPFEWVGLAASRVHAESGLDEVRRTLAVTLPAMSDPGPQLRSLEVLDGGGSIVGHRWVGWEVAAALKASPSGLVFATGAQASAGLKVVVRTRDGRPFRIASATTEVDGLKVVVDGDDARPTHLFTARFEGPAIPPDSRSGEIVIRTDHPGQPVLKVAVFVTGWKAGPAPQDAPEKSR